mmetsp:Transcript_135460/g.289689  ORF Transcript_135460/g.289689 Transcript_135460/m.289689 type:complete len:204 (+) Transcript_135460:305-916(+)
MRPARVEQHFDKAKEAALRPQEVPHSADLRATRRSTKCHDAAQRSAMAEDAKRSLKTAPYRRDPTVAEADIALLDLADHKLQLCRIEAAVVQREKHRPGCVLVQAMHQAILFLAIQGDGVLRAKALRHPCPQGARAACAGVLRHNPARRLPEHAHARPLLEDTRRRPTVTATCYAIAFRRFVAGRLRPVISRFSKPPQGGRGL